MQNMTDSFHTAGELSAEAYKTELLRLQLELVHLQEWVRQSQARVVIVFEGRDAAGKGGVIKRITEPLSPRICRVEALGTPTDRERSQWYFQRYVSRLPAGGEIVLFDRSWYNRAGVERVMGFCSDQEYYAFLYACPRFEELLVHSGIILLKYWFSVSEAEQERRFQERAQNPLKRWKLSAMDLAARDHWAEYSLARDIMIKHTDTRHAPWYVVEADIKERARLNCISHLLEQIPYQTVEIPDVSLGPRRASTLQVERIPKDQLNLVPDYFSRSTTPEQTDR
ncbi:MAG: polyphosphate kinase 2 [Betaproteobacteria bacterium]|nr:polyphosphate kinase 2 [Betaproteobacteria bacterium]